MNNLQEMPIDFRLNDLHNRLNAVLSEKQKIETEVGNYKPHDRERRLKGFDRAILFLKEEIQNLKVNLQPAETSNQIQGFCEGKNALVIEPKASNPNKYKKRTLKGKNIFSLKGQIRQLRAEQLAYIRIGDFEECQKIGQIINKLKNQ